MSDKAVYETHCKVRFSDCGKNGRIRMSEMLSICSDTASDDFDRRGYTVEFLENRNMIFVLSAVSFGIKCVPSAGDELRVFTWKHSVDRAMFNRGFRVIFEDGRAAFDAMSGWLLVDPAKRRIRRPSDFDLPVEGCEELVPDAPVLSRIDTSDCVLCGRYKAMREHIDSLGHMNNSAYGNIITDFLTEEEYAADMESLKIRFINEMTEGCEIDVFHGSNSAGTVIYGSSDGKKYFESEISFKH